MKLFFTFFVLLSLIGLSGFSQVKLDSGLIAYYPFNGNANDESGGNHDGITSSISFNNGVISQCANFSGIASSNINTGTWNIPDTFSISTFFQVLDFNTGYSAQTIFSKYDDYTGNLRSMYLNISGSSDTTWFPRLMVVSDGTTNSLIDGNKYLKKGQWYHCVVTYNGSNTLRMFLNDTLVAEKSDVTHNGIFKSSTPAYFGIMANDWSPNKSAFNGMIDEFRLYNRVISTTEIDSLYNQVEWPLPPKIYAVYDIDSNGYDTVRIGNQTWLKQNLNVSRYNDGTAILYHTTTQTNWSNYSSGAYAYYNNDTTFKKYGALYNWHAVQSNKLCPSGWNVPNNAEWKQLFATVGTESNAAKQLKTSDRWNTDGVGDVEAVRGTDAYGFSALPGGNYLGTNLDLPGYDGGWWSFTESNTTMALGWGMDYDKISVRQNSDTKSNGYSIRCLKEAPPKIYAVYDIDSNGYDTVRIGNQTWLKQNLNVSRYNDGTLVPNVTDNATWAGLSSGARCYYDNDSLTYANTYGALYNWYVINESKEICPLGFHISSEKEWNILINFVGGEADMLKEAGIEHWVETHASVQNLSGFTALPSSYRNLNGTFTVGTIGTKAYWWSKEENNVSSIKGVVHNNYSIFSSSPSKNWGASIRCAKDCQPPISANAGSDQLNVLGTTIVLSGNIPTNGNGKWSIVQGAGGKVADSTKYNSLFTGVRENTYKLIWLIANGCAEYSTDTVTISFAKASVYDIDGNGYDTVRIGNQTWLKQNLNVSRYNDGTPLHNISNGTEWGMSNTGAYSYYMNDSISYSFKYGALYNWYSIKEDNLCPIGWKVPSDKEWTDLSKYLGENVSGGKLKEVGLINWSSPNLNATNETGFTALPGGYRTESGGFGGINSYGYWWSITENSTTNAWDRHLSYNQTTIYIGNQNKLRGASVRCLKFIKPICFASFTSTIDSVSGTATLTNTTNGSNKYYWDFNDDNFSNAVSPTHKYLNDGIYRVSLTATDTVTGCQATTMQEIKIKTSAIEPCHANYTYVLDTATKTFTFTNTSTAGVDRYYWEFGDGTLSNVKSPTHKYNYAGYFAVSLIVIDTTTNCVDSKKMLVKVDENQKPCKADYTYSVDLSTQEISFADNSDVSDSTTYLWDFNDGYLSTLQNPEHTYSKGGFYDVCLTVNNAKTNCRNTSCQSLKASSEPEQCNASFTYSVDTLTGIVDFFNTSKGKHLGWTWEFGNGNNDKVKNAKQKYSAGYYSVILKVEDSISGCKSFFVDVINVKQKQKLKAGFGYEKKPSVAKGVLPVEFKGASYGDASEVEWDFGDGTTNASSISPIHEYKTDGTYLACYTVTNSYTGETDSACQQIEVVTTGIEENRPSEDILIYPNPATNTLYIHFDTKNAVAQVEMSNTLEQTVYVGKLETSSNTAQLDVSDLMQGLYFIKVQTENSIIVKKVIKK